MVFAYLDKTISIEFSAFNCVLFEDLVTHWTFDAGNLADLSLDHLWEAIINSIQQPGSDPL